MFLKIVLSCLFLAFSLNATLIKGEDSEAHFLKITKVDQQFHFFDCQGILTDLSCEPIFGRSLNANQVQDAIDIESEAFWIKMAFNTALIAGTGLVMPVVKGGKAIKKLKDAGTSFDGGVAGAVYTIEGVKAVAAVTVESAAIMYFDTFDAFINRDLMHGWEAAAQEQETSVITIQDSSTDEVIEAFGKTIRSVSKTEQEKLDQVMRSVNGLRL